ncbi:hypothetical protein [Paradevosia shaoguanensis]|uniref:Uncharacterized protein n=1 Tax=Paradevosia shaoguanensis TaxID=1335043 RepID=A0AA41UD96_9HYPH|nr:hypothetical protein [Paradevosia shaoguanensis]MCF1744619.1 hypothetical protein [Paradevosia shaoguanensis]MCI0129102.1 hypothetical protein [Paradevosia shaoguanensis]
MFNVEETPTFIETVTVVSPDGEGTKTQTFRATFRLIPLSDRPMDGNAAWVEFLREVIVTFDDLVGNGERPIPYSEKIRDWAIQRPDVHRALVNAFFAGSNKGIEGN